MIKNPNSIMTTAESRLLVSELQTQFAEFELQFANLQAQVSNIPVNTTPTQNPSGAVNQIRNGDFSHSVNSWANGSATDDSRYECAWWYSHPIADGQAMYKNTTLTGDATLLLGSVSTVTDTIRHSGYPFITGQAVTFTGSMPSPLAPATIYYIIYYDSDRFQVAATYADAIAGSFIPLTTTTTGGNAVFNFTLKNETDTEYSLSFSDWDWPTGSARFQGQTDVSCFFPSANAIQPGYTYVAVGSFVKLNKYIACQAQVRLFAGLYANSVALPGWDWVYGDFIISYEIIVPTGYSYVGGVPYTYQIHAITNRDFTLNSSVLSVADGPAPADWAAGVRVILTWNKVLNFGVNSYNIYRTGSGTGNVRLFNVVNGTSYIDNNGFQETGTIPAADYDKLVAYTSTNADIINTLPYQGDPLNPIWAPIPFSLKVPQNFDMGDVVLDDGVWLRMGFQGAPDKLDLDLDDGIIFLGDTHLSTTGSGQFRADQVGCSIDVFVTSDSVLSTTITSFIDSNHVEMADPAPDDGTDRRIYIHEGAPGHCISVDLCHVGFVPGATFAYNPEDMSPDRGIPPVVPNGTNQGGNPGGQPPNTGDGHPVCLWIDEEVVLFGGKKIPINQLQVGDKLDNGYCSYNKVTEIRDGVSDVNLLVLENGAELLASPTKQVFIAKGEKKVLSKLVVGDIVLTSLGKSKVLSNERAMKRQIVRQISLSPTETFLAGGRNITVLCSNNKPIDPVIV